MRISKNQFTVLIVFLGAIFFLHCSSKAPVPELDELLRTRIETAGYSFDVQIGDDILYSKIALPRFYEQRCYQPVWVGKKGPHDLTYDLVEAIQEAGSHGLRGIDYHLELIQSMLNELKPLVKKKKPLNFDQLVELDLLLTDAFLVYGSHLHSGRLNPETIHAEWLANRRESNLDEVLEKALAEKTVQQELNNLAPPQQEYAHLRNALAKYREIKKNGGWPYILAGPKLQRDDRHDAVITLRKRLKTEGYRVDLEDNEYDEGLEKAVRKFQERNGLDFNGKLDENTYASLNESVEERIARIEVNLERWRWLPQDLGQRHILVNIADYDLSVVEGDKDVLSMRVIVGKSYRSTPVFSDKITYLVLSPYWHVSQNMALNDILPQVRKDADYLAKKKFRVFKGWGSEAVEINPGEIDWKAVKPARFGYRFVQDPGPENALGKMKFMFPNKFNVYLHDTPTRELFKQTVRDLSSGCIRLEKPLDLAEYLLKGDSKWTRDKISNALKSGIEQTVSLPEPIPVHLLYWTAWVNNDGDIHFRRDIYSRDKQVVDAMQENPPEKLQGGESF